MTASSPPMLDLVVVGLGPGGAAAALAARRAGLAVLAVEARGPEATRAQLILVRPGARAALARIGFADITEGRRTTTIRHVENRLRAALEAPSGSAPFAHHWHTSVVALHEAHDHVRLTLRDEADGRLQEVRARHVIDASGGRLDVPGRAPRLRMGPSHWVITAEYAAPPWFDGIVGMHDRATHELYLLFPTWGRRGVIAYLDAPPGPAGGVGDGTSLAGRFATIAAGLDLGAPLHPAWAVDVVQHLLPGPTSGRIVSIGDAVGTVDVLTGNGMSIAIEDAVATVGALCVAQRAPTPASEAALLPTVHAAVYRRHRRAMWRGRVILAVRPVLERIWPAAVLPHVRRTSLGPPPLLWPMVRVVFGKRPAMPR